MAYEHERDKHLSQIEQALDRALKKTMRVEFAKVALQGMLANEKWDAQTPAVVARIACDYADALIAELKP